MTVFGSATRSLPTTRSPLGSCETLLRQSLYRDSRFEGELGGGSEGLDKAL